VGAFYPALGLVIGCRGLSTVKPWCFRPSSDGKRHVRGEQRARYDQLRRDLLREQGLHLIELNVMEFLHDGRRTRAEDLNGGVGLPAERNAEWEAA
jgi:hypothetical protein